MVLPLYDDNTDRVSTPFVNYALIAVNVLVFVFLQRLGENEPFTYAFSTVPREIVTGEDVVTADQVFREPRTGQTLVQPGLQPTPLSPYLTLLTSMFMHGSLMHLAGNMLFLWIFGDNVEDALGHARYLLFYLLCGVLASLAHVFTTIVANGVGSEQALVPSLGASGAISGVLGGYILLFPHKRVTVLMFRFLTTVPAWVVISMWFAFQIFEGLDKTSELGGVAYAAHIGGFLFGLVLAKPFALGRPESPRRRLVRTWPQDRPPGGSPWPRW
jgi:membrane associated rhomboid family serine protease